MARRGGVPIGSRFRIVNKRYKQKTSNADHTAQILMGRWWWGGGTVWEDKIFVSLYVARF